MCVGIPMRVVESGPFSAICEGMGRRAEIDMRLVGAQPEGVWVLTFLDAAREVIDAEEAAKIVDALSALQFAMQGDEDRFNACRNKTGITSRRYSAVARCALVRGLHSPSSTSRIRRS